jgi:LytS/YehU family sensor histidine kinase
MVRVAARRVPLERPWMRPLVLHALFALTAAFLFSLWFTWMLWLSRPPTLPPVPYLAELGRFVAGHMMVGVAAYASVMAVCSAIDERAAGRRRELDTVRLEADLAQAQLRALQMQLQPHFLFNTLHGIAMLTDTDPAAAESMAVKLADLLRATLRLRDVPEVALRAELELLRAYLEIEEVRFGDRLVVTFTVPEDLLDVPVPSFLLQPIVENAVRHGVAPRVETGHISIAAVREPGALVLSVEDDGAGFGADPFATVAAAAAATAGVGMSATRDRLALRYGAAASIVCEARRDGAPGARVAIRIPFAGTNPV